MNSSAGNVHPEGNGHLDIMARSGNRCGSAPVTSKDVKDA
jgi:hypothetical protein